MNIYKLEYTDRDTAIADLISKAVLTNELQWGIGIEAVVEIGKIMITEGTCDKDGNELTPFVFSASYHFDIMSQHMIEFTNVVTPDNPKHRFAGY
jgi:hypothetical protein